MINTQLTKRQTKARMSDLKESIGNYRKTVEEAFLLYSQGIGTFTTQALDKILKEIILGISRIPKQLQVNYL